MCADPPLKITLCRKATSEDSVEFSLSASIAESEPLLGALSLDEVFPSVCLSLYAGLQAACVARLRQIVDVEYSTLRDLEKS